MKFVLEAHLSMAGATLDPPDGYDCCVVEIDREYAAKILTRMQALQEAQKLDSYLYEMYYWDYHAEWFSRDWDENDVVEGEAQRTECDQLVVRADDVCWITIPKHTDLYMLSDSITRAQIAAIAAGDCVPT